MFILEHQDLIVFQFTQSSLKTLYASFIKMACLRKKQQSSGLILNFLAFCKTVMSLESALIQIVRMKVLTQMSVKCAALSTIQVSLSIQNPLLVMPHQF